MGRRSVGKSSLTNALLGAEVARTGLGGVTEADGRHEGSGVVVVDTPGLEDPLAAADALEAALPTLDAIVWVVDGLQPLTALEREALDDAVPDEIGVHVLVSRLDLVDPAEHDAILGRVRAGTRRRAPLTLAAIDARRPPAEILERLRAVDWERSPRRRRAIHAGAEALRDGLGHLGALPDPAELVRGAGERWHTRVHDAHDVVAAEVREGRHLFRDDATRGLHARAVDEAAALAEEIGRELGAAPTWRPSPVEALDVWGQAQDLLSGTAGVLRGLREAAAAWASEGRLAWLAFAEEPVMVAIREQRARLAEAREAVQAVLDVGPLVPRG